MQRSPGSFIKNLKERKNVVFFWKERMPNPAPSYSNSSYQDLNNKCLFLTGHILMVYGVMGRQHLILHFLVIGGGGG